MWSDICQTTSPLLTFRVERNIIYCSFFGVDRSIKQLSPMSMLVSVGAGRLMGMTLKTTDSVVRPGSVHEVVVSLCFVSDHMKCLQAHEAVGVLVFVRER